jgi:uncharacterized membrane protein
MQEKGPSISLFLMTSLPSFLDWEMLQKCMYIFCGDIWLQVMARFMEMMQLFVEDDDGTEASDGDGEELP